MFDYFDYCLSIVLTSCSNPIQYKASQGDR